MNVTQSQLDFTVLASQIKRWGLEFGFQEIGITDTDLTLAEDRLQSWLAKGFHGEMKYMQQHGTKRSRPQELVAGTIRVIIARMNYLPKSQCSKNILADPMRAFISRYALGRDYHKLMRKRLAKLASKIALSVGEYRYRVFTDSAPVMEKPLAEKAGLGWIGKHTNLIKHDAGSWFFLGSIYTDLPLPIDQPATNHCGSCSVCIDICPTQAIIGPYQLDARRCISYLTIELKGSIPEEFRELLGNRIYGCDDCQLFCPWNKFAKMTVEKDFQVRHGLDTAHLLQLFNWDETDFLNYTLGSAIRRIGYECWLRNIAVALGNAPYHPMIISALKKKENHPSELVREHVIWALQQQQKKNTSLLLTK